MASSHASDTCAGVAPMAFATTSTRATRRGELAVRDREPRDEADAVLGAVGEHVCRLAVGQVVQVLHGDDLGDLASLLDLGRR